MNLVGLVVSSHSGQLGRIEVVLRFGWGFDNFDYNELLTNKSHHQDTKEDSEGIADNVHEDNGDQGDRQVGLALSPLAASST